MKADNILIDQDGMCKISDFGTSKKSGELSFACYPSSTRVELTHHPQATSIKTTRTCLCKAQSSGWLPKVKLLPPSLSDIESRLTQFLPSFSHSQQQTRILCESRYLESGLHLYRNACRFSTLGRRGFHGCHVQGELPRQYCHSTVD